MSRVSTLAGSSFSPDRMFRSTTAPVSKFLNLVRVNAAPLPGLTNWNSITLYGFPSIKTLRPLRISDVSYISRSFTPPPPKLSNASCRDESCRLARTMRHPRGGRCGTLPPAGAAGPGRLSGLCCPRSTRTLQGVAERDGHERDDDVVPRRRGRADDAL